MKEQIILPNNFLPEGRVKVELFDDLTGKKVEEIETKNFISKGVREYLFKFVQVDLFTRYKYTGSARLHELIDDPFHTLALTDANHPEQPNEEWLRRGKLIGYAYTNGTYSGSDSLRGSYNAKESFTNLEQVHIVIDFPTHAANGTFQSVYFQNNVGDRDSLSMSHLLKVLDKEKYIVKKHDNRYYMKNPDYSTLEVYDLNFNLVDAINIGRRFYDFIIVGNYIYFCSYISPYGVYRAPLSEPTNHERIVSGNMYGITYDSKISKFYITLDNNIEIRDHNMNLLNTINVKNMGYPIFFDEDTNAIINNMYAYLIDDGTLYQFLPRGIVGLDDNFMFFREYNPNRVYRYPKIGFSSRALLDMPVTKTPNNTMKVTYDFMLPKIF